MQQEGLQGLLGDVDVDDFNWFDAIDEIDDSVMQTEGVSESASAPKVEQGPSALIPQASSQPSPSPHSGSDASSYDLVEMFRQQVEQQAAPVAAGSAMAGPAFVAAPPPAYVAAAPLALPFAALPPQQLMCGMPGPFATACMTPAFLPAALAGAAAAAPAPTAGLNNAVSATPAAAMEAAATSAMPCRSGSGAAPAGSTSCGGRRSRSQKTQEEIDAAVERIKQKRRESAQRSRARKNDYMRQLELENQALKDEVQRLQQVLAAVQRSTFQQHQAAALVQLGAM